MTYGYSAKTIRLNKEADKNRLGIALGKAAIKLGISVADIALTIGVSRQTVYNWFVGAHDPKEQHIKAITKLLDSLVKHIKESNLK
jgi:DNA-binding XRE family transcriptional regulator